MEEFTKSFKNGGKRSLSILVWMSPVYRRAVFRTSRAIIKPGSEQRYWLYYNVSHNQEGNGVATIMSEKDRSEKWHSYNRMRLESAHRSRCHYNWQYGIGVRYTNREGLYRTASGKIWTCGTIRIINISTRLIIF